jgi:hypothetical protein
MGSELVAARIAIDLIIEMRYKLRLLGVRLEEQTIMLGDNMHRTVTTIPSWVEEGNILCSYVFAEQSLEER